MARSATGPTPICDRAATSGDESERTFAPFGRVAGGEVVGVRIFRRAFGPFALSLLLTLFLGSTVNAGEIWCVKDPIFEIDGRVVSVQDFVPLANADTPLHFVLYVAEDAKASWRLPPGETLVGSVTIVRDDRIGRDSARLTVTGEGARFPMRLAVSGTGLRTPSFERHGTSHGMSVTLRLVPLAGSRDDD